MLKQSRDGLSRDWSVRDTLKSFYRGGKVAIATGGEAPRIGCLNEGNVSILAHNFQPPFTSLLDELDEGDDEVISFAFHPSKQEMVAGMKSHLIVHWDYAAKKKLRSIRGPTMPMLDMDYDPTGTLVAAGLADRSVRVWDIPHGHCTHVMNEHSDIVTLVRFHPDAARLWLLSASDDCSVCIHDLHKKKTIMRFSDHASPVSGACFFGSGAWLVTSGRDQVLNFYSIPNSGKGRHEKTVAAMDELAAVQVLSEKHSRLVFRSSHEEDGTDGTKGKTKKKTKAMAQEELAIITAGRKGMLHTYRVTLDGSSSSGSMECVAHSKILAGRAEDSQGLHSITRLEYCPRSERLIVVNADSNFAVYSLMQDERTDILARPTSHLMGCNEEILALRMLSWPTSDGKVDKTTNDDGNDGESGDGTPAMALDDWRDIRVAVATNSPQVRLVSPRDGFCFQPLDGHVDIVMALSASPDGAWITTVSKDKTVRIWNTDTQVCVALGAEHTDAIGAVDMSQKPSVYSGAKGSTHGFIVTGAADKVLKRWSVAFPKLDRAADVEPMQLASSHSVRAHEKDVNSIAVAPNDSVVASASMDKTIRVWRSLDLFPVATLRGHKRGVWCVQFSPVDKELVSCSGDRTIKTWSLLDYSCTRSFEGHTASVLSIGYVCDGQQVLSTATDGLVKLWTLRTGECEATFDEHADRVWAVASGLGRSKTIMTGGSDATLKVWQDTTAEVQEAKLAERERLLLMEQQLANDLREKKYDKALRAALDLHHANKVLGILMAILEADSEGNIAAPPLREVVERLDTHLASLSDADISLVVEFMKDWNTNARFAFVAQATLSSLIRVHKRKKLEGLRSVSTLFEGLSAYSQRHLDRVDRLQQAANLMAYATGALALLPAGGHVDGAKAAPLLGFSGKDALNGRDGGGAGGGTMEDDIPALFGDEDDFIGNGGGNRSTADDDDDDEMGTDVGGDGPVEKSESAAMQMKTKSTKTKKKKERSESAPARPTRRRRL